MIKKITVLILMIMFITSYIFASNIIMNTDQDPTLPSVSPALPGTIKPKVLDIWATIVVLVQILSVGCFAFAGLRYMFASADQKADIKQGLINLAIGAFIAFGATTIIRFVVSSAKSTIVQ